MKQYIIVLLLVFSVTLQASQKEKLHPVHTYSIVAYDSATGQFGAAVQSHWFKVADVIWAEPGVGAVATQSLVDFSYGPLGLEMMKKGKSAKQALEGLLASDENNKVRQVAIIDKNGDAVTHTGLNCIAEAGHVTGHHYSVQANLMEKSTVWQAMADAFESADGDLAERMMIALEAAQNEGGDIRGKQSAAMIVVSGTPTGKSWVDRIVDIRVDDSKEPLKELRRLLNITRAYQHMNKGDEYIEVSDFDNATKEYELAVSLSGGNIEISYWYAVTLTAKGQQDKALPMFRKIFKADKNWQVLIPRLVDSGILPNDSSVINQIMAL